MATRHSTDGGAEITPRARTRPLETLQARPKGRDHLVLTITRIIGLSFCRRWAHKRSADSALKQAANGPAPPARPGGSDKSMFEVDLPPPTCNAAQMPGLSTGAEHLGWRTPTGHVYLVATGLRVGQIHRWTGKRPIRHIATSQDRSRLPHDRPGNPDMKRRQTFQTDRHLSECFV